MKNNIIVFILTALVVFGCSDEFTTGTNKGSLSDAVLANEQGVDLLLVAAYSILDGSVDGQNRERSGDNWWIDVLTDEAHKGSTNGDQAPLHDLQTFNNWTTTNGYFFLKWEGLYAGVNRANGVISLANSIEGADLAEKIAEAKFLRAHFNFELTRMWRDVAFVDEVMAVEDPDQPNSGPLWSQIEADLNDAITGLPETSSQVGRANEFVARAYLGKVLLYQEKWAAAETQLDDVIARGGYSLNTEFIDNFNGAGKNSSESVFSIQHTANDGATNNGNGNKGGELNFPGGGPYSSCCGFYQPTHDLLKSFQTFGGLPDPVGYRASTVANDYNLTSDDPFTIPTNDFDPRADFTVGRRGVDYNGWAVHVGFDWVRAQLDAGPYLPKKNTYKSGEDDTRGTAGWGQQTPGLHYNVIRYADVLLMAAEAKAEQGDAPGAMALVNQVRARAAGMIPVPGATSYNIAQYTSGTFDADAVNLVRFERHLELAMEGHRYFDLVRWGIFETRMAEFLADEATVVTSMSTTNPGPQHTVFPIPLRALDVSLNLTQHSEWSGN